MNRAIINPGFLIVFFSPVILLFLNTILHRNASATTVWSFLLAALLFFIGVGLVTVFKNVPLNEIRDKAVLETASQPALADLRNTFEQPWNQWHMVRTVLSFIPFVLLLVGIIFSK